MAVSCRARFPAQALGRRKAPSTENWDDSSVTSARWASSSTEVKLGLPCPMSAMEPGGLAVDGPEWSQCPSTGRDMLLTKQACEDSMDEWTHWGMSIWNHDQATDAASRLEEHHGSMMGRLLWYGVASFCNLYRLATTTEDTQASCAAAFRILGGSYRVSPDHDVQDESPRSIASPNLVPWQRCHELGGKVQNQAGWVGEPSTCSSKL